MPHKKKGLSFSPSNDREMVSVSPHFALRSRLSSSMPVGKARKRTNNGRGRCRALWRVLTAEGRRLQTRRSPFEAATAFKIFHSLILSPHHCRRVEGGNVFSSLAAASRPREYTLQKRQVVANSRCERERRWEPPTFQTNSRITINVSLHNQASHATYFNK